MLPESVSGSVAESTDVATPIESTAPVLPPPGDPAIRRPTRPSKPHTSTPRSLKVTVPVPQPIVRPPSEVRDTRRRTRLVPQYHVADKSLELSKSNRKLAEKLTLTYQLNTRSKRRFDANST